MLDKTKVIIGGVLIGGIICNLIGREMRCKDLKRSRDEYEQMLIKALEMNEELISMNIEAKNK